MSEKLQAQATSRNLYFLGPEGSFTHQAALAAVQQFGGTAQPCGTVQQIMAHVEAGDGWGVVAWENNVEGYVIPNLDMLIDSNNAVGCARISIDIAFDAFVQPGNSSNSLQEVCAHPHGLAQCTGFAQRLKLKSKPASSNAAACRDVEPGQVALGPSICGSLYGLETLEANVQDYQGARTDFLVVAPRAEVEAIAGSVKAHNDESETMTAIAAQRAAFQDLAASGANAFASAHGSSEFETVVTFVPLSTGPGVLANLLDMIRDAGLNMTSFMSRPIKGRVGTYSFIATLDAAPWQQNFHNVLEQVVAHGDWAKTLAVYSGVERPHPPVDAWMLPQGGACGSGEEFDDSAARRELLW